MSIKAGDRVFFDNGRIGTVTYIYESDYSGNKLADIKSCGQFYSTRVANLNLVPKDWVPRWRNDFSEQQTN